MRPFSIPKAYENMTRSECKKFKQLGIWEHILESEWTAPSFFVPKKTGDGRIVMDFHELNKYIVRKLYPLPKIQDLLQKLEKFKYTMAIDLRRGYYHIPLDEISSKLCMTVFPWGKYSYKKLPMGLSNAPDIFQHAMNIVFADMEFVMVYLDNVLILSNEQDTFANHLNKCHLVLE